MVDQLDLFLAVE